MQSIDFLVGEIRKIEAKLAEYLKEGLPMQVGTGRVGWGGGGTGRVAGRGQ